jgi:release factor glutamine methyltransferase
MTALSLYKFLTAKKININDLQLLISAVLKIKKHEIFINNKVLSFLSLIKILWYYWQLYRKKPIAYIIKNSQFYMSEFYVDKSVLIPRSETEYLVEYIINNNILENSHRILEIGTGSGCIAISLKKKYPSKVIVSVEISQKAINIAIKNAKLILGDNHGINFIKQDIYKYKGSLLEKECLLNGKFDFLVSNPPYIGNGDISVENSVKKYEPLIALFSKNNGLYFYQYLPIILPIVLKNGGNLYIEFGINQGESIRKLITNFKKQQVINDVYNIGRYFYGINYGN